MGCSLLPQFPKRSTCLHQVILHGLGWPYRAPGRTREESLIPSSQQHHKQQPFTCQSRRPSGWVQSCLLQGHQARVCWPSIWYLLSSGVQIFVGTSLQEPGIDNDLMGIGVTLWFSMTQGGTESLCHFLSDTGLYQRPWKRKPVMRALNLEKKTRALHSIQQSLRYKFIKDH